MTASDPCRVEDCDRRAAVSVVRDDLPGPIRLCATHTEDFRMNGPRWVVEWEPGADSPVSVTAAPLAPVGRSASDGPVGPAPKDGGGHRLASRLPAWLRAGR
ncbi:MAG TPA: hypothetical protein VG435_05030 [Acidimicrobiales bacterium]|jgi:hypothetical protein|nr:hypothetical protein [Acidimicrobiales bacterium]